MPSGLHIITGNRMEILAAGLAELLKSPPNSSDTHPLRPQSVMVQSKGMQRWISMAIARLNGICANIAFPFPNSFLDRLYGQLAEPLPERNPFEAQAVTFRILNLLPQLLHRAEFRPLQRYLSDDGRPVKRYQLARKIADMFDQYAVFRPDMLLAWEANQDMPSQQTDIAWQAELWRQLVSGVQTPHRSALQQQMVRQLKDKKFAVAPDRLPDRLSVFGISHLPPFHLQVLEALSHRIPVYLFLLNPCRHYWFDILSDRQITRLRTATAPRTVDTEQLYLERGNRLLASFGLLGKQFFEFIYQNQANIIDEFRDNCTKKLLGRIQQDILELIDRPRPKVPQDEDLPESDGTLRIHSVHSVMREVEVLHDQILDIIAHEPSIQPRDIIVMTPKINHYAPYIHAVFGAMGDRQTKIPYTVADQNILSESPVVESFVQILDMVGGRFEASRVLAVLECPAVHQRFEFSSADTVIIERWIRTAGIRWGWDSTDRKRHHLPGFQENTWRNGLDRLTLGYSLATDNSQLFANILPSEDIGTGQGPILGRLAAFAEALHNALENLAGEDDVTGWCRRLNRLIDRFYTSDHQIEHEMQALRGVIDQLEQIGEFDSQFEPISFDVVRQHIKDALERISYDTGFMVGGVTFCAMLPMRSIPAQVICLLGMNHDAFPREQREPGFNLMATEPRSGDRSKRNDDRYLFLEALISARKVFYLSFIGQDIQDNTPIPPSVVVDELAEYVSEGFGISSAHLIVQHPLHGFSPSYFDGKNPCLFSYSKENKEASAQLSSHASEDLFFEAPLKPPDEQWRRCEWQVLATFFSNPTQFLLEHRLGVYLLESADIVEDRENFVLDHLQRYQVNQQLLKTFLHGGSQEKAYQAARAGGTLPHGTVGQAVFEDLSSEVQTYLRTLALYQGQDTPLNVHIELDLPPFFLHGNVDGLCPFDRIVCRLGNMRPKDLLSTFIFHLALLNSNIAGLPKRSVLICKDEIWHFGWIDEPDSALKAYLALYWEGMQRPLPFFIRTSFEYASQRLIKEQSAEVALLQAARMWHGNDYVPGESSDPYIMRCLGDKDPLTSEFEEIALTVFSPILTAGSRMPAGG